MPFRGEIMKCRGKREEMNQSNLHALRFSRSSRLLRVSQERAIAVQSFTTIHRTAAMASTRSTTVPPMIPTT